LLIGSGTVSLATGIFTQNSALTLTGNFIQNDGTFDQNAAFSVGGNFSQFGGIFVSDPAKNFTVGNSFSLSGGTFSRFTGLGTELDPYLVYDIYGLQGMGGFLTSTFGLANDIDASATANWNAGAGFIPIGNSSTPFSGSFNGVKCTISGLFIDLPSTDYVGLFGETSGATLSNVGLLNANITGQNDVGSLAGANEYSSSISSSYATGSVSGSGNNIGGLVGSNVYSGAIDNSYASGNVSGSNNVGGLVGLNYDLSSVINSYAIGRVSASSNNSGGLVGYNSFNSTIDNSYAAGSVSGSSDVGGLIGNDDGSNTLMNNWWYNSLSNGIGNIVFDTSIGHWQEALSASDFYDPAQAVYTGTGPWDFTNIWLSQSDAYPVLRFDHAPPANPPSSNGPASTQLRNGILNGTAPEITEQDYYNPKNILLEGPAGTGGDGQQDFWAPYGEEWMNIQNNSKLNMQEADHAVQEPWGVELLPSSASGQIQ
jgi:hypothetical protein